MEMETKYEMAMKSNNNFVYRNNIEISGIPNNVGDDELEGKFIDVLEIIDVTVSKTDIEACHRLPATKKIPQKEQF